MNDETRYTFRARDGVQVLFSPSGEEICRAPTETDAAAIAESLNRPIPAGKDTEYLVSSEGFWMAGMAEEETSPETLTDPHGRRVGVLLSDDMGGELLKHLNRPL